MNLLMRVKIRDGRKKESAGVLTMGITKSSAHG